MDSLYMRDHNYQVRILVTRYIEKMAIFKDIIVHPFDRVCRMRWLYGSYKVTHLEYYGSV